MAVAINMVIVAGNLTRDPELRYTPKGTAVADFAVAVNSVRYDGQGEKLEEVEFVNVTVWDKQAESSAQYLKKGSPVLVQGRMKTESWDDKDKDVKHYKTKVVADRVQFLGTGSGNGDGNGRERQERQERGRGRDERRPHGRRNVAEDSDRREPERPARRPQRGKANAPADYRD